jgi:cytidylate kinase
MTAVACKPEFELIPEYHMSIVTICRGTKSGGEKLAQCLADKLGYSLLSREVILECARKYNIMEDDLFRKLETTPSLWQKFTMEHKRYFVFVQCALIDAVKDDNVVYHGYAGQVFLTGIPHVLKTRLDTPLEDRIKIIMKEKDIDAKEARRLINNIDEQRRRWIKDAYGMDWRDPSLYDISFSTANMTLDTICDLITRAVNRDEFKTSEISKRRLLNLSMACEVKAAFASDDKLWHLPITVSANDGTVTLKGAVKDKKQKDMLVDLAAKVKGVVDCDVHIRLLSGRLSKGVYGHD